MRQGFTKKESGYDGKSQPLVLCMFTSCAIPIPEK